MTAQSSYIFGYRSLAGESHILIDCFCKTAYSAFKHRSLRLCQNRGLFHFHNSIYLSRFSQTGPAALNFISFLSLVLKRTNRRRSRPVCRSITKLKYFKYSFWSVFDMRRKPSKTGRRLSGLVWLFITFSATFVVSRKNRLQIFGLFLVFDQNVRI